MGNQLTIKGSGLTQAQILSLIAANASPLAHKTQHQNGGSDAITVQGLAGVLTAEQLSSWAGVSGKPTTFTPAAHNTSHQLSGSDALNLAGLAGKINYVDRGDQVGADFDITNFSVVGTWTNLDCSTIVPAGAIAISSLFIALDNTTQNAFIQLRKDGNSNTSNIFMILTPTPGVAISGESLVFCSTSRIIEYYKSHATITAASMYIKGWFLP